MTAPKTQLLNLQTRTPTQSELVIASFFDLDGMAEAVTSENFTLREEIALLIDNMRDADPKVRLAAQKQWHTLKKDILTANGLLGTARARETTTAPDGRVLERSASTQTLLTRIRDTQEKQTNVLDRKDPSFTFLEPRDSAATDARDDARLAAAGTDPDRTVDRSADGGDPESLPPEGPGADGPEEPLPDEPPPSPDRR